MVAFMIARPSASRARGSRTRVASVQPWPDIEQTPPAARGSTVARSASSSTMWVDLPPSSITVFFTVGAAAASILRPTAVEPVKVTMSTRGSKVRRAATSLSFDTTTWKMPGGMSVSSAAMRPQLQPGPGGELCGLEDHRVAGQQRRDALGDVEVERGVPWGDGGDHADRDVLQLLPGGHAQAGMGAGVAQELEAARVVRPVAGLLDRERQLDPVGHGDGRADLGDENPAQPLLRAGEAVAQLGHAVRAELHVVAPVPRVRVERPPRGGDRPVEVIRSPVGGDPGHLLSGRVDDVERRAAGRANQLAVDEEALFAGQDTRRAMRRGSGHGTSRGA